MSSPNYNHGTWWDLKIEGTFAWDYIVPKVECKIISGFLWIEVNDDDFIFSN